MPLLTPQQISNIKSRTFDASADGSNPSASQSLNGLAAGDRIGRVKLTDRERARVEQLIRAAGSLAEISRLEKELNEGRIPGGVLADP